ncbi:MAG: Outer membrane lipoprotein Blc [uncultured Thiotrichaceae bacterium]|uniref:Outer membrane lipoprotein Blc n=1 Tax=uncultured Thiotrichaceae bacterium TaxID=298394 RepID=A0A6S6U1E5_9GAMM|nr:MAG: Outer membrane lipoprotein Blc [uncultured Thiotrichaceae bacterium]
MIIIKRVLLSLFVVFVMTACASLPDGIKPVEGFDVQRYLGKWYEIARLDHSFERGLSNITAEYSIKDDGSIRVLNRGFKDSAQEWSEAEGKAKFTDAKDVGALRVSFFGPFYGGYNIIELDKENYQYALIVGNNMKYLWILSRSPILDPMIQERLISKASELGFPTNELIIVKHDKAKQ